MNNPVFSQRRFSTLADAAMAARLADDKTLSVIAQLVLVLAGSALLAVSAQISTTRTLGPSLSTALMALPSAAVALRRACWRSLQPFVTWK